MNGFTIISKDDDFEKIVLLRKAPPKLIYLKTYNLDTKKLIDLIIKNKDKIVEFDNSKENDIFEIYSN
jgi:predicted nuclease of predicted toxin-antitoxin system